MRVLHIFSVILLLKYVICYNETANTQSLSKEESNSKNLGKFWQITDIHWDIDYSEIGDPDKMCHKTPTNDSATGHYGNYFCDSPYTLVRSVILAMKQIEPHPDFILWTGDNGAHTENSQFPVLYQTFKNVTEEMLVSFGSDIPIIPVLGNHDTYPRDDYPPTGEFYERYLDSGNWKKIIPKECHEDFIRGGYYKIPVKGHVEVFVLNTNLYYRHNHLGQGLKDPGGQFKWLKENLQSAKDSSRKVILTAHSPPGYWERRPEVSFLNDTYNDNYVDLLNDFGDQIIAHIYGHEHTDSFKLFGTNHDDVRSIGFLAPSITPWHPNMNGGSGINPSVRLYTYTSLYLSDYIQYHMNLTEANKSELKDSCIFDGNDDVECDEVFKNLWKEYYRAAATFGIEKLDAQGMKTVFSQLYENDTYFQEYFTRNSAGVYNGYCNDTCKQRHLCAMSNLKTPALVACLNSADWMDKPFGLPRDYTWGTIIGISVFFVVTLLLLVFGFYVCTRPKGRKVPELETLRNSFNGYKPLRTVES